MLQSQAGNSIELPSQANREYREQQYCEIVREVYQILETSSLDKFTYPMIHSLWNTLSDVIHQLERLYEAAFKEMIEVIEGLSEARNELRLSCFLFDVEEINPLHRLIMRNRAVRRGKQQLQKMLLVWPASPSRWQDDNTLVGKTPRA